MVCRVDVYIMVPLALKSVIYILTNFIITYILPHKDNIKLQRCRSSGRQY